MKKKTYLDVHPNCISCPVEKYCGTMTQSTKLCNSYEERTINKKDSKEN